MSAFSGFYESPGLLHWAMRAALHCKTTMAIKMASDRGTEELTNIFSHQTLSRTKLVKKCAILHIQGFAVKYFSSF
jgi:hypothetical protein